MPIKDKRAVFMIIFMLLGFIVALQFRSTLKFTSQKPTSVYKIEELQKQVEEEKKAGELLKAQIAENEKNMDEYLKAAVNSKNDNYLSEQFNYLERLKLRAGLVDVKGAGVVVKLDDAPVRTNENPNVLIIHDSDIIAVVNELKKAGAQAISINGERLIATSEQVCAGPTVRINMNRYAAPFVISAIGDADLLYESVKKSEPVAYMIKDHIRVDIEKLKEVTVPKYNPKDDSKLEKMNFGLEVRQ